MSNFSFIGVITAFVCLIALCSSESGTRNELKPYYVRAKLIDYVWTGNGCDPFGNKCDPKFRLEYHWLGQSEVQEIGEHSSHHEVYFTDQLPRVFTGPFPAGSNVVVNINVKDVDFDWDDHMSNFRFEYRVPSAPGADQLISMRDGGATFRIEFRTIFL